MPHIKRLNEYFDVDASKLEPIEIVGQEIVIIQDGKGDLRQIVFAGYLNRENGKYWWDLRNVENISLNKFSNLNDDKKRKLVSDLLVGGKLTKMDYKGINDFGEYPMPISLYDINIKTKNGVYWLTDTNIVSQRQF